MLRHFKTIATFSIFIISTHSLHLTSPNTCGIPYLVPLLFQHSCDRSDEYFRDGVRIAANIEDASTVSFTLPPSDVSSAYLRRAPNIWTTEPFCLKSIKARQGFCVYTNARFAHGRGISIISTPSAIHDVVQATMFKKYEEEELLTSAENAKNMHLKPVAGQKRYEVVANITFERGAKLHSFHPIVLAQHPEITSMEVEDQTLLLKVAVARLPVNSQRLFMMQYAEEDKDPYIDRMDKNGFNSQLGQSEEAFSAILPESARFNHDCRPNTAYHFNPETLSLYIYVIRSIEPGEEVTVSYLPPYLTSSQRQVSLRKSYSFNCTCSLCTSPPSVRRASDSRLRRIQTIINELNVPPENRKPDPLRAEQLVMLHEQEGLCGALAGAQMYVAMEYQLLGNKDKARDWASKAKEGLRIWSGEGHEYHTAMLKILGEEPALKYTPYTRLYR